MSEQTGTAPVEPIQQSERISQLRKDLMPDSAFEWEIAAALDCSRRKVQKLGLPFEKIGGTRIYSVPAVRSALRRNSKINPNTQEK